MDSKHKKLVCRYWLNSRCTKGNLCEFLHALDLDRMPECQRGQDCANADCSYKHSLIKQRVCANYQLGFCSFGSRCAHAHVESTGGPPSISAYWTINGVPNKDYAGLVPVESNNYRRKKCEYFETNKWCPYFDMCNFVHS